MPITGASEFTADKLSKPVRLLGEDLTLYKYPGGRYGLVARHCSHRGTDLSCGTVEETGLRCFYHGRKFDERGQCIEQPYEDIASEDPSASCATRRPPAPRLRLAMALPGRPPARRVCGGNASL